MFGYVKPFVPGLMVCEYDYYKAVYCGVCRELGRLSGPFLRLTLSYDFVFVALFAAAASGEGPETEPFRCALNPLKKRNICIAEKSLKYAAACAMILMYYKCADDAEDKKGPAKLGARLACLFLKRPLRRACSSYPALGEAAEACTRRQRAVENDPAAGIDMAADPTGRVLSAVLEQAVSNEPDRQTVGEFGYMLGRWVYLTDAADDAEKDRKSGGFNPLADLPADRVRSVLNLTLTEADSRYGKIPSQYHHPIIDNIVTRGLPAVQQKVLAGPRATKGKKHGKGSL